jgi:hypothetical protein
VCLFLCRELEFVRISRSVSDNMDFNLVMSCYDVISVSFNIKFRVEVGPLTTRFGGFVSTGMPTGGACYGADSVRLLTVVSCDH